MEFDLLNLEPHKISESLEGTCFVYGNPKVGKSTFCTKLYSKEHYGDGKECLLLAFEKGYQFLNVTALDITKYSDLRKVIRQLKDDRVKARYGTIIFDTVDIFAKLAEKSGCAAKSGAGVWQFSIFVLFLDIGKRSNGFNKEGYGRNGFGTARSRFPGERRPGAGLGGMGRDALFAGSYRSFRPL